MSFEDLDAFIRGQFAEIKLNGGLMHQRPMNLAGFCPTHLGHWIELCQKAEVPFIPAEPIAGISRDVLSVWDVGENHALAEFYRRVQDEMAKRGAGWMIRWPFCAGDDIKYHLGTGKPQWQPKFSELHFDDMRFNDLLMDFPYSWVHVYARPWQAATVIDSYPVEFRVFVDAKRDVSGISSYYPQRPLPETPQVLEWAAQCERLAERLAVAQDKSVVMPDGYAEVGLTADFLVTDTGEVVFIEGGPGLGYGAHPCCFPDGKAEGVALKPLPGSPLFDEGAA